MGRRTTAQRSPAEEQARAHDAAEPTSAPPPGVVAAGLPPGLTTPGAVVALQRSAGNAAVARAILQRRPAAPSALKADPSQVVIKPEAGATDPMSIADVMTSEPEGPPTVEPARKFGYTSNPTNLLFTWRLFDGADRQVKDQTSGLALVLTNAEVRAWVRKHGRSALGTWTVRLEKDDYFHDVAFDVGEGPSPGPALAGSTTQSYFNLRELPSEAAPKLGELAGDEVPIKVDNKARTGGRTWYRVTLGAPTGKLAAGTVGWIVADAVVPITGWDQFRGQLRTWEAANAGQALDARITHLRQICHDKDLPFDDVIGVKAGKEYADTRPFRRGEWELLRDSQQVRMPDGRVVDVYHLLVGLDVLPRKDESKTISLFPLVDRNVGPNYSAATWSGDIGAAAADAALGQDAEWEKRNPGAGESDKVERYYSTRVSQADLYGDIDAWEITEMQHAATGAPSSIEELLAGFYGAPVVPSQAGVGTGMHVDRRKSAVERFLRHYGFGFGPGPWAPLVGQKARDEIVRQIETFGKVWLDNRDYELTGQAQSRLDDLRRYSELMGDRFLDWLEKLGTEVGART